jgi:hypothetical protein
MLKQLTSGLVLVASLTLAGCGGDEPKPAPMTPPAPTTTAKADAAVKEGAVKGAEEAKKDVDKAADATKAAATDAVKDVKDATK